MQDINFEDGVWAVIVTKGMGTVIGGAQVADTEELTYCVNEGLIVDVNPCFGLNVETVPVQGPQGMGMSLVRQCVPLGNCAGGARLLTSISGYITFESMTEEDKRRHKGLVSQLMAQLMSARAQASGIITAGIGDIPNAQRRPS